MATLVATAAEDLEAVGPSSDSSFRENIRLKK